MVEAQQIKEQPGAHPLLSVPIETSVHAPGLLLVFLYGRPLFVDDDLALLQLYAERTAITLDNIRLLAEQQELVEKLVQNEAELEEQVAERTAELSRANEQLKQEAAERRQLNEKLEQRVRARTAQLEVANKELESFAYSVSHDLRAPLRAIDGFSQALLEDCADQIDDQGQLYLGRVRANTQRMGELIDALLLLSRLSRAETVMEAVDLSALAKDIAADLKQEDDARRVQLSIEPGLVVEGDARLLRVVLENLLGNAWKFTSKRSEACIEFGAVEEEENYVYYVRDNGVGFDMAYADKLFGAFQRLHPMNEFPGTGIGLATVQRVIHRHHGRVWAEAAPDKGATFFFTVADHGEKDGEE
ncbi:MAG: sensor histidine kinase [Chloroflexota bacterium]